MKIPVPLALLRKEWIKFHQLLWILENRLYDFKHFPENFSSFKCRTILCKQPFNLPHPLLCSTHFPPLWQPPVCSLNLYIYFCFVMLGHFYFLYSMHKWNNIVLVFLWLILLGIIPSKSIHVLVNDKISFSSMAE